MNLSHNSYLKDPCVSVKKRISKAYFVNKKNGVRLLNEYWFVETCKKATQNIQQTFLFLTFKKIHNLTIERFI